VSRIRSLVIRAGKDRPASLGCGSLDGA